MEKNEFSEVISSAQKRASDRQARITANREKLSAALKTKHEVLHTVIGRTLLQAWKDLEAAGVKAAIETYSSELGDWQISLSIPSKPLPGKLIFSVKAALVPHLGYNIVPSGTTDQIDYHEISDDITPVEVARIVAGYISNALG